MKKKILPTLLLLLAGLSAQAQLSGTGYYRFRNAQYPGDYIRMSNDKFNYHTAIATACGGLSNALTAEGQARAVECAGRFLETDIHMVEDAEGIDPATVIYAKKKNTNASNHDYNLIGQGTSLLTLTTGTYDGSIDLQFQDRYITIETNSGSGANTLYTAKIELKSSTSVIFYGQPSLGTRYLVDDKGTFAIDEGYDATNAKWYIEPVTHFNVRREVEYNGRYYTTLYVPFAYQLSGQVEKAYAITGIDEDGTMRYEAVAESGGTVPAGTPVILECASGEAAACQLIPSGTPLFTAPDVSVTTKGAPSASTATDYTGTNILKGDYYCNQDGTMTFTTSSGTGSFNANHYTTRTNAMYLLGITEAGLLGFVKATGTAMPANKAWIEYTGAQELVLPISSSLLLGDVNRDGELSITDVTALVNIILGKDTANEYDHTAADVNQDGDISISDVTALVNLLLGR